MIYYTFRVSSKPWYRNKVFECCKWSDSEREPVDVYNIVCRPKSFSCSCYSKGECRHITCVVEILDSGLEDEMHHWIWSYENTWQRVDDLELEIASD